MPNNYEIKKYLSQKFGCALEDWSCIKDDYLNGFKIRNYKNKDIEKTIETISCDDDIRKLYIRNLPWHFKIIIREFTKNTADTEDLDDIEDYYEISFYEENNFGNFDWHVSQYLYEFHNLSEDYEEDLENSFIYQGSEFVTLGDVKTDLINNGFIFDGYEEV